MFPDESKLNSVNMVTISRKKYIHHKNPNISYYILDFFLFFLFLSKANRYFCMKRSCCWVFNEAGPMDWSRLKRKPFVVPFCRVVCPKFGHTVMSSENLEFLNKLLVLKKFRMMLLFFSQQLQAQVLSA